jgi:hypothetical protein
MNEFEQRVIDLLTRIAVAVEGKPATKAPPAQLALLDKEDDRVARGKYSMEFEQFWKDYPRTPTMSKPETWKQWLKLSAENRTAAKAAIEPYRRYLRSQPTLNPVHACRFLSQERFSGFFGQQAAPAHNGMDGRI